MILGIRLVGDPTALGWTTFVLYLLAAGLCFRSARVGHAKDQESKFARIRRVLAVLLFLLGLNKQLDLQTILIEWGRRLAMATGTYQHHRDIQLVFFTGLAVGLIVTVAACRQLLFAFAARHRVCAVGFGLVGLYTFIRAGSIDHVDEMLGFDFERIPGLWVLEVAGLVLVIATAIRPKSDD